MYFFFFNDTATTEIYTLSLHDALPILTGARVLAHAQVIEDQTRVPRQSSHFLRHAPGAFGLEHADGETAKPRDVFRDRKSTRLNSSHSQISYAVFCLKK